MRNSARIRAALDRAQHAGHVLTPDEIARFYKPDRSAGTNPVGVSPLDRQIVRRQVVTGTPAGPQTDRVEAALDLAQHGGQRLTPEYLETVRRKPRPGERETPLARRAREAADRARREAQRIAPERPPIPRDIRENPIR